VATITGQPGRSPLPGTDTPRVGGTNLSRRGGYPYAPEPAENAALAWRTVTAALRMILVSAGVKIQLLMREAALVLVRQRG